MRSRLSCLLATALWSLAVFVTPAVAADTPGKAPVAGVDYIVIPDGQPFQPLDGKIEVVEVFGYVCPHCAHFQVLLDTWKPSLADDVRLTYVPASFGGYWIPYARAYYAAEAAGLVEQTHSAMFRALHQQGSLPLQRVTVAELSRWYGAHGADPDKFSKRLRSPTIDDKLERATRFIRKADVEGAPMLGTPMIIVNGKYRVLGRSFQDLLRITDQLIEMERQAAR